MSSCRNIVNQCVKIKTLIGHNPYRVLGVYVGEGLAKEYINRKRIEAFSKVGQRAEFPLKGDEVLPKLKRNSALADAAFQNLSLPLDRVKYAMFWYADEKSGHWAFYINQAVDWLLKKEPGWLEAFASYDCILDRSGELWKQFVETSSLGMKGMQRRELAELLIDTLCDHFGAAYVFSKVSRGGDPNRAQYLNRVLVEKYLWKEFNVELSKLLENNCNVYDLIDNLAKVADSAGRYVHFVTALYDSDSVLYKEYVETFAEALYKRGRLILKEIGDQIERSELLILIEMYEKLIDRLDQRLTTYFMNFSINDPLINTSRLTYEQERESLRSRIRIPASNPEAPQSHVKPSEDNNLRMKIHAKMQRQNISFLVKALLWVVILIILMNR